MHTRHYSIHPPPPAQCRGYFGFSSFKFVVARRSIRALAHDASRRKERAWAPRGTDAAERAPRCVSSVARVTLPTGAITYPPLHSAHPGWQVRF